MKPIVFKATEEVADPIRFVGQFMTDEGVITPVTFRASTEQGVRDKMLSWLEAERIKAGVTAEKLEQRKAEREARKVARAKEKTQ